MQDGYFSQLQTGDSINCLPIRIPLKINTNSAEITLGIAALQTVVSGDLYEGEYVVTPDTIAQTLPTEKKTLMKDITVKEIPFFETGNTSGGTTVYIAGNIEIL